MSTVRTYTRLLRRRWTIGLLALLVLSACTPGRKTLTEDEEEYLEKIWPIWSIEAKKGTKAAIHFIDSVFQAEQKYTPFKHEVYYQAKGWLHTFLDEETAQVKEYLDSLRSVDQLVLREQYSDEYLRFMLRKARLYIRQQLFDEGIKCFFQVKVLAETAQNAKVLTNLYEELGNASYRQKQYDQAVHNYKMSRFYLAKQNGERNHRFFALDQGLLNNIGLCFARRTPPLADSSYYYYNLGLDILNQQSIELPDDTAFIRHAKSVIKRNVADIALENGEFEKAEKIYLQGIEDNIRFLDKAHVALFTVSKLGQAYVKQNRLAEAKALLEKGHFIRDSLCQGKHQEYIDKFSWMLYDALGNSEKALLHHKRWAQLQLSNREGSPREFADIDFEGEFNKYQNSLDLGQLKETEKLKTQVLIGSSVLAAILLVFFVQIRLSNKKLAKLNERITLQNNELRVSNQALKESEEENARIMKVLAHDLRNPIGGFASLADALLEYPDHTEDNKEMIELIQQSAEDALGFVNDLLSINVTSVDIKKTPVELDEVMAKTLMLLKHKAAEKNIVLKQNLQSATVQADREKLSRVFGNLLSNAIKFSHIDSTIEVAIGKQNGKALISVKDYGLGIPEKIQKVLFDISHSKKRHGTAGEESFGLGLSICKQIVEAHEGRIWFETEEGKGTTFFVEV